MAIVIENKATSVLKFTVGREFQEDGKDFDILYGPVTFVGYQNFPHLGSDVFSRKAKCKMKSVNVSIQMEQSALKSELEKERQALENAMAQAQLASEREQENKEMLSQLERLQVMDKG